MRPIAEPQRGVGNRAFEAQLHRLVEHVGAHLAIERGHFGLTSGTGETFIGVQQTAQLGLAEGVADGAGGGGQGRVGVMEAVFFEGGQSDELFEPSARIALLPVDVDTHHGRQVGEPTGRLINGLQRLRGGEP